MKFPSVEVVYDVLRNIRDNVTGWAIKPTESIDVRLQVYPDGEWAIRTGLSDYDQDHRGYWGAASVSCKNTNKDLRNIAEDLIEQVQDHAAQNDESCDV